MTIVPLNRVTLYGEASQKADVIRRLQGLGCLHLVSLRETAEPRQQPIATTAHRALRYLAATRSQHRQVRRRREFDCRELVAKVIALEDEERDLREERESLLAAIAELEPWGEFDLPPGGQLARVAFTFHTVPLPQWTAARRQLAEEEAAAAENDDGEEARSQLAWREIRRDHRQVYLVILQRARAAAQGTVTGEQAGETPVRELPGQRVELDPRPLSQLRQRLEEVEERLADLHYQRVGLTRWREALAETLDRSDDAAAREWASGLTLEQRRVFALQGWLPVEQLDDIRAFAAEHGLALVTAPPTEDDAPPTLLRHPESLAGGESLVTFYKTPAYHAWDPSLLSWGSFALFFAMILADAGYAAVLGLLLARYWPRLGERPAGRRGRVVLASVLGASLVYGVLCGSYFGFTPPTGSLLDRARLIDATSQQLMMPLTIAVGLVHLCLANVALAIARRGRGSGAAAVGWVLVMAGVTLAAGVHLELAPPDLTRVGGGFVLGGLVVVLLLSSERPLWSRSPKTQLLRVADGLQAVSGISGLFGDVLSYLRLFALGLSSAKLAATFNDLAQSAWDRAGFGVIAAIAIFLLGHALNLLLGIMSGVVHGLRLNCIEFFKWGLPEEGYSFSAFAEKGKTE